VSDVDVASVWDGVVGQPTVVEHLQRAAVHPVHAYLFLGPPGSGKRAAARAFAALLLDPTGDIGSRDVRLALAGEHPDVREVERQGASISRDQIVEVIRQAATAPAEGPRKVLILDEFHLLEAQGAARLLKTLEEPPDSTVFIVIADQLTPELVTIASRCVRVDFGRLADEVIAAALVADGVALPDAQRAAAAAGGDLGRGRLLAHDPGLAGRQAAFFAVPEQLDGTGARVVTLVEGLSGRIDEAAEPLKAQQAEEVVALDERVAASGERGAGRKAMEDRHRRELRRLRTDEWRWGLAVIAARYRDALVSGDEPHTAALVDAVSDLHRVIESLDRNPNEALQLQALFLRLPSL
jgi:DNA polymerase-3 subunit delta'